MAKAAQLLIVGNGMATGRLLSELIQRGAHKCYQIHVFGDESHSAYNRVLLSPLLGREIEPEQLQTHPDSWYAEHGIELHCECQIKRIDPVRHCIVDSDGQSYPYDRLVLATGSRPAQLDRPGEALAEVMGFRTLTDVERLQQLAAGAQHAVVIGGGLLGLEAAEGLRLLGLNVTLIHRGSYLLNRQLDPQAANLLQQQLEARGLQFRLNRQVHSFCGDDQLKTVELDDGTRLSAELAVVATGITPNIELAHSAGLECDYGIRVDNRLRSSDPKIFALGECCQFEQHRYGMVAPIWQQASALAEQLTGQPSAYTEQPFATQLKVSGIELFSFGQIKADAPHSTDIQTLTYQDPHLGDYRKLLLHDNRLIGAVLYGDISSGQWYFDQFLQQQDLSDCREDLLLGQEHCVTEASLTETATGIVPAPRTNTHSDTEIEAA